MQRRDHRATPDPKLDLLEVGGESGAAEIRSFNAPSAQRQQSSRGGRVMSFEHRQRSASLLLLQIETDRLVRTQRMDSHHPRLLIALVLGRTLLFSTLAANLPSPGEQRGIKTPAALL
ncbi:hypothetical protein [Delftia tsuruhatensis]|uniref:hypothetical protein n=1 Tax=Delftia tsuruhatensis TaxID=180282 RepID=UPI00370B1265